MARIHGKMQGLSNKYTSYRTNMGLWGTQKSPGYGCLPPQYRVCWRGHARGGRRV